MSTKNTLTLLAVLLLTALFAYGFYLLYAPHFDRSLSQTPGSTQEATVIGASGDTLIQQIESAPRDALIELPAGVTNLAEPIDITENDITIKGHPNGSTIRLINGNESAFRIGQLADGETSRTANIILRDFTIEGTGGSSEFAVESIDVLRPIYRNITFRNVANGIKLVGNTGLTITNFDFENVSGDYAFYCSSFNFDEQERAMGASPVIYKRVDGSKIYNVTGTASDNTVWFELDGNCNTTISRVDVAGGRNLLSTNEDYDDPVVQEEGLGSFFGLYLKARGLTGNGIEFYSSGRGTYLQDVWLSTVGGNGMVVGENFWGGLTMDNFRFGNVQESGIQVLGGENLYFTNGEIVNPSLAGNGAHSGVYVGSAPRQVGFSYLKAGCLDCSYKAKHGIEIAAPANHNVDVFESSTAFLGIAGPDIKYADSETQSVDSRFKFRSRFFTTDGSVQTNLEPFLTEGLQAAEEVTLPRSTTDLTAAIETVLANRSGNVVIRIPRKMYTLTAPIRITKPGVHLIGNTENRAGAVIKVPEDLPGAAVTFTGAAQGSSIRYMDLRADEGDSVDTTVRTEPYIRVADTSQVRISNMFIRNGSRGLSIEDSSDITVDQVNLIGFDGPYGISIKGTDETTRNVAMYRVSGSDLGGGNEVCATNQDLSWLRIEGDVDTIDIIEPLFIRGDYGIEVMAGNAANTSGTIRLENWGTDNTCAPSIVARSGDYTIDAIMPWIGQVNEGDGVTALAAFSGTLTMKNPTIRGAYRNGVSMGGGTVEITNPLIGNNGQMFRQTGEGSFAGIHIRQSAELARIFGGVSGMLYNGNVRIDRDDPELDVSAAPGNNGQNFGIRIDNARSQVGGVDVDWNIRDGVLRTN